MKDVGRPRRPAILTQKSPASLPSLGATRGLPHDLLPDRAADKRVTPTTGDPDYRVNDTRGRNDPTEP